MSHPVTPDGRYLVVRGRLWRCSDPSLSPTDRQRWVDALMNARRAVRSALRKYDDQALRDARSAVRTAKEALGERGPPWWTDGAVDVNRRMAVNTVYADWYKRLGET